MATGTVRRGGRHARKFELRIGRHSVLFSLRSFRTAKATRSRKHKQYVYRLPGRRYKELALKFGSKRRRQSSQRQARPLLLQPLTYITLVVGVLGCSYFGYQLRAAALPVSQPIQQPLAKAEVVSIPEPAEPVFATTSEPVSLQIPRLQLNAPVMAAGLKNDGSLSVPNDGRTVGWYKNSPTPGQKGPSVFAGHVDSLTGPAIFWRLHELQPGDSIITTRADGSTMTFTVDEVKQYAQTAVPEQEVYGNIDHAGIRLITCSGSFNEATRHYSHNTVVFGSMR